MLPPHDGGRGLLDKMTPFFFEAESQPKTENINLLCQNSFILPCFNMMSLCDVCVNLSEHQTEQKAEAIPREK